MLRHAAASFLTIALACTVASSALAAGIGDKCSDDRECVVGSICSNQNVCVALSKKKSIIPFYFHQPGDSGYRHITPLLYFHSWDKHTDTRVQVPLFGWRKNHDTGETTTVVPLLFSSLTTSKDAKLFRIWPFVFMGTYKAGGGQAAILPLFWWSKKQGHSWFVAPLLLSGGQRDDNNDISEGVLGLIGYYRRHGDDSWRVLFPVLFEHETPRSRTLVGPFMWFHSTPEGHDASVIFPLWWQAHDERTGYDHKLLLPLFDWESEQRGAKQRLISIAFAWERDDSTRLNQFLLYVPPVFHRRDAKRTVDVVPPLFTRWSTTDGGGGGLIAGPLVHVSDPAGSTTSLFPIYWRFHDRAHDATTHLLLPIAGFHHHTGARGGFVGPIYSWSSSNGEGGWGAGLAPIAMFGRTGTRSHALVLPLFARWSDTRTQTSTTAVGPLFWRSTPDGGDGGLIPLLFAGRHKHASYAIVPGLFWHKSDEEGSTNVVGPAYWARSAHGWAAGLAPLAFFGKSETRAHQVIFPLVWHFSDRAAHTDELLVGPYYHGVEGAEKTDALFPLFYVRRSPRSGIGVWPIGGWRRVDGVSTTVVGPFVHQSNAAAHSKTSLFFPLLTLHDSPKYSVRVLFPFIWRVRDGDETDTAIFPLYFRGRAPDHGWDGVFPLFIHNYNKTAATTIVGPIWYRARTDGGKTAGLFPLLGWGKKVKDGKSSSWFGMPGIYADNNQFLGTSHTWMVDFFFFGRPDGYTAGLLPIAFAWRRGTASKVLTPIYYRQADSARDYSLDVFTLFFAGHEGKSWKLGLFPIFLAAHDADGGWRSGLFPLFYASRAKDHATLATLLGGFSITPAGKRFYVGPFYYRNDAETTSAAVFPLAYFGKNHTSNTRTSFILPLYLDVRRSEDRQLAAYTPLIWRYHSVEATTTIGLPLYFDVQRYGESRTTALLPLFVRNRSEIARDTGYTIPPLLTWWRTRDDHSKTDAVVFPLVWHFGGKSSTTVVAPFVWDFKRGDARTTVAFPLFAHWRRTEYDRTIVLNVFYGKGLGDHAGEWHVDVFPLIQVGRPRKHDIEWSFLEGLFGYSRQGRNRNLRLFWILDFALEPVPASNLSWFGSTTTQARELF
ncbi:MAG: hypothetical protein ACXVDD_00680 [Polyangia bacterium]